MMLWLLLLNVAEVKKRDKRKINGFRKKLIIPESEILECPECPEVKSTIGNISVNKKILEEYSVKILNIDPLFCEHYKGKIQVDKKGWEYILFRIDVYFTEYLLAIEIDEKTHVDRDLIFEEKRQKALEKKLVVNLLKLIRVSVMMKIMKLMEYEHISVNSKTDKKINKKIKELENKIEKLTGQITQ